MWIEQNNLLASFRLKNHFFPQEICIQQGKQQYLIITLGNTVEVIKRTALPYTYKRAEATLTVISGSGLRFSYEHTCNRHEFFRGGPGFVRRFYLK